MGLQTPKTSDNQEKKCRENMEYEAIFPSNLHEEIFNLSYCVSTGIILVDDYYFSVE